MADVTPKELASAREAAGLYQYQVASLLGVSEYTVGRWERGEEAPAAGHVLARQPPAHQRALPAEHTGGEGMSYNPYTAQERHRRAQPRREAIRGADMARCAAITFAAVMMLLGAWILM